MMKYDQNLKRNLWSWILLSTGAGLSTIILVELLYMPKLLKAPKMIEFMAKSNGSNFIVFKVIFLFFIFFSIFYLMFFLQSAIFAKKLNLQARSLLSLDKYVQFKKDYRFELMGDDKKYITEHSDQMDSYHNLRRITIRKPLNWVETLFIVTMPLIYILFLTSVFYPNSIQRHLLYGSLYLLDASLILFVYLFRSINSLLHASQKVDEHIDNSQGIR